MANHQTKLVTRDTYIARVLRGDLHIPLVKTKWRKKSIEVKYVFLEEFYHEKIY